MKKGGSQDKLFSKMVFLRFLSPSCYFLSFMIKKCHFRDKKRHSAFPEIETCRSKTKLFSKKNVFVFFSLRVT